MFSMRRVGLGPLAMIAAGGLLLLFAVTYEEDDAVPEAMDAGSGESAADGTGFSLASLADLVAGDEAETEDRNEPLDSPCYSRSPVRCTVFAADRGSKQEVKSFWGAIECDLDDNPPGKSGPRVIPEGGDPHPTASGAPGSPPYRELVTHEGDVLSGERCEIGRNDFRVLPNTVFYREGDHLVTFVSVRLPKGFPVDTENTFQGAIQMKQTQPSDVGDEAPPIAIGMYQGRWQLFHSDREQYQNHERGTVYWTAPLQSGLWTRFVFDVVYSGDPDKGRLKVYADLNADGDFTDEREQSPLLGDDEPFATLRSEVPEKTPDPDVDGLDPGDPVPSHLRVGLYHSPEIDCPDDVCRVQIDNVQVARARGN